MRIQRIVLGRTVNLGNYESVRCDIDVEVAPTDVVADCVSFLEAEVDAWELKLKVKYHVYDKSKLKQ